MPGFLFSSFPLALALLFLQYSRVQRHREEHLLWSKTTRTQTHTSTCAVTHMQEPDTRTRAVTNLSLPCCLFLLTPLTHFHLNDCSSCTSPVLILTRHTSSPRGPPPHPPVAPSPICGTTHTDRHTLVLTLTLLYCFCHLKSSLSPKLCLLLLYFGTQCVTAARVNWIWMRHLTFCLPNWRTDWLTDCLCRSLSPYRPSRLTELLSVSVHCNKVYLPICLCLSEFMAEWIDDPQLWPHLFMSLSVHFLPICLLMPFNPFPPSGDIYLVLFACVSILTRNRLCCLVVLPHFITCLTDLCVIKHSALLQICTRDVQTRLKCLVTLRPRGGFAVIEEILLFIEVVPMFPAGSCPMPQRTLQPCWAHLKKEPSTWPGPSLLMATVPSYATYWRFLRTVSHIISSHASIHCNLLYRALYPLCQFTQL